jgi:hypothetical protein
MSKATSKSAPITAMTNDPILTSMPVWIYPKDWPVLQSLAWSLAPNVALRPAEALSIYERNWRSVDVALLQTREQALLDQLTQDVGGGVFMHAGM